MKLSILGKIKEYLYFKIINIKKFKINKYLKIQKLKYKLQDKVGQKVTKGNYVT